MQSRYLSAQKLSGASVVRVSTMQSEASLAQAPLAAFGFYSSQARATAS